MAEDQPHDSHVGVRCPAQFPYAQWMSWNIYDGTTAVPTFTFSRTAIRPDPGSVNPFVQGVRLLAPLRSYHLYLMPAGTDPTVIATMKSRFGEGNVGAAAGKHH